MSLEQYLSKPRWDSYKRNPFDSESEILERYLENIRLCEALYPSLHIVEIALRNQIDYVLTQAYKETWLSEASQILETQEQNEVSKTNDYLQVKTRGHLIAELRFSFWTSLFKKPYRNRIWHQHIKQTFPHLIRKNQNPAYLYSQLQIIRKFRNRVFHHEPLLNDSKLQEKYNTILIIIQAISPDLIAILKPIDRFPILLKEHSIEPTYSTK